MAVALFRSTMLPAAQDAVYTLHAKIKIQHLLVDVWLVNFIVGPGKNHKDAASVRATHAIPASCGIYYYEVKVISKGRDG